jgi:hypothetical protein
MKPAAITGIFMLLTVCVHAQLTLMPQAGFERTPTRVTYNTVVNFTPSIQTDFKGALRLDYRFKQGYGPYIAIGTSPAVVNITFDNPASAMTNIKTTATSLQWRMEAGMQYSTKAIKLGKTNHKSSLSRAESRTTSSFGCGARMHCGNKMKTSKPGKELHLRIQPAAGFAYIPANNKDFEKGATLYQYTAGNYNSAFVSAMGFELGKGKQRLVTLSVHYTKGLGNLDTKTMVSEESGKPLATSFKSESSSWGVTVGVPFTISKAKEPAARKTSSHCQTGCGQYRMKCVKKI